MGITAGFLVKHVRPQGIESYEQYCNDQLIHFLVDVLLFSEADLIPIFAEWKETAESDPERESGRFTTAAKLVAEARWSELYPTNKSTVMFFSASHLAELSEAGEKAGPDSEFDWRPVEPLEICVTIHRDGKTHVIWEAAGCRVLTDENSNVCHFIRML